VTTERGGIVIGKYSESLRNLPKPKKAAIYLRVSSDRQTLESQRADVEALARARGFELVRTFEEQISAVKRRPAFEEMLTRAAAKDFDAVIVWAVDRFGRTLKSNLRDVWALDEAGVALLSVRETWLDTTGPMRSLLLSIFSWIAEHERTRLIERVRAFQKHRRSVGGAVGRPPYGWRADAKTKLLTPEPLEAALVCRVRAMRAGGVSLRKIVYTLNNEGARNRAGGGFNRTQIARMLARPEGKPWKETRSSTTTSGPTDPSGARPTVDGSSPSTISS